MNKCTGNGKRILTILKFGGNSGGYYQRLYRVLRILAKVGYEVHYISNEKLPINYPNLHFHKIKSYKVGLFDYVLFVLLASVYATLLTIKYRYDCLFSFSAYNSSILILTKMIFNIPLITFVRGDWLYQLECNKRPWVFRLFSKYLYAIALRSSTSVIANSKSFSERVQKIAKCTNIKILYNDVPEFELNFLENDKFITNINTEKSFFYMGYIGKVDKQKNVRFLIEVLRILHDEFHIDDMKLIIVGNGTEMDIIKSLVYRNELENFVIFAGWQKNIDKYFTIIDLLLLASRYEGCPNVLLESLGRKTLCLGNRTSGIEEILKYDELLFDIVNPYEVINKILTIKNDDNYKHHLYELIENRRKVFSFDWDNEILQIFQLYA